ncbi:DUF2946 family protein [Dokdonella fugitiva]|jgi:hypothetical protein|uniref:DUF2946 family protein n=1 Tax=Dokdonella fugitiva TaxID=328517 RepID=A0A4R2IBQ3_9GAMM|nr:DUF2946 family protein [Dokdonella fugitiva]TCO41657.1 DUF2946 family protein [Dokdonella fugitiva]
MMGIASRRLHRAVAWMGLVAILLLALVPTASRIASACAPVDHGGHAAHAHHHADVDAHESTLPGEDCWSKCAYCDFLAHSPSIANAAYVAPLLLAPALPPPPARATLRPRAPFTAALPRGPPSFPA